MRYIFALFLISLVSSSEIISKTDEIKEFAEYEDVELQYLFTIIAFIGKLYAEGKALFASAWNFIIHTKVFKFVKNSIGIASKFSSFRKN